MALIISPKLLHLLGEDEGVILIYYLDPKQIPTIGIGHNLRANPLPGIGPGSTITLERAYEILQADLAKVVVYIEHNFPWAKDLNEARQAVLISMVFQLGIGGVLGFGQFLKALQAGNYAVAADEMLDSLWAREDSPNRAKRLSKMMRTGRWLDE